MLFLEQLLDIQVPSIIRISPDKQNVVYSTSLPAGNKKGDHLVSAIWVAVTCETGSARKLTNGDYHDRDPKWLLSGRSIAFVSDRAKHNESSAIYIVPVDGGEPRAITPIEHERPIEGFELSPDGKTIAFLSADEKTEDQKAKEKVKDDAQVWGQDWAYNRLRLVDIATETVTTLASIDKHIIGFGWNDDGTRVNFAAVKSPDPESCDVFGTTFFSVDIEETTIVELCAFPTFIGDIVSSQGCIYFIGQATERSLVSGKMVYKISSDSEPCKYQKYGHGVEDCAIALRKRSHCVIVQVEYGMENQLRILGGATLFSEKKALLGWDVACDDRNEEAVITVALSSTDKPPELYSISFPGGSLEQLSEHGHPFAGRDFGSCAFLSCRSADGKVTLDATWHSPPGRGEANKPLPTVVFIHGGPYGRHNDSFDNTDFMWGPILLDAGFAVLVPNYRGGSSRGDEFASYARGIGRYDYEDIITLTQHAVEEGLADRNRLLAAGWSFGGTLSYLSSVRNGLHGHGWKFRATIPGAGVSDSDAAILTSDMGVWKAEIAGRAPWRCEKSDVGNRQGSAIWEFHAAVQRGNVIPPMLILHPELDRRVPVEQAHAMRRGLQSAGLPFECVVYPREGHHISERNHLLDMGQRVLRFVEKHIGQGAKLQDVSTPELT